MSHKSSIFKNLPKLTILAFLMNFCPVKCKRSSLRSHCCMRHFLVIFKHCGLTGIPLILCLLNNQPHMYSWYTMQQISAVVNEFEF